MQRLIFLSAACAALSTTAARAELLWTGDFSTGDLSQWSKLEITTADRLQVVPDPVDGSRNVLRVLVRQGDDPIGASGYRNEVLYTADQPREGEERYYRWQTYWPHDYESADTWQLFTQWHHFNGGGSPPVSFYVRGEEIVLATARGNEPVELWKAPLQRGQWHDFVFHVTWSSDPGEGAFELWYDGALALPSTPVRTLFPNDSVYLKQGLYRDADITFDQVVFHTGMKVGTTLESVWPSDEAPVEKDVVLPDREIAQLQSPALEASGVGYQPPEGGCSQTGGLGLSSLFALASFIRFRRRR